MQSLIKIILIKCYYEKLINSLFVIQITMYLMERKKRKRNRTDPLTQEQVIDVISAAHGNPRDEMVLELAFNAGQRVSEIAGIELKDIDWDNCSVEIWDEKKDIWGTIYLPKSVIRHLRTYVEGHLAAGEKKLFDVSHDTLENIMKKYTEMALGRPRSFHVARKTWITLNGRTGRLDRIEVAAQTRDKPKTIDQFYDKVAPEIMKKKLNAKPLY